MKGAKARIHHNATEIKAMADSVRELLNILDIRQSETFKECRNISRDINKHADDIITMLEVLDTCKKKEKLV